MPRLDKELQGQLVSIALVLTASALVASARPLPAGAGALDLPTRLLLDSETLQQSEQPFQFTPVTAATLVLSMAVSALSNAAGVGGGALFVPLFNALLGLPIKGATALSQAVITGGALGSVAYSLGRRHPQAPAAPLVDAGLALALAPPLLTGVAAGVLLNIALPNWLITFLLIPLLAFLTYRTLRTGLRMRHAERQAQCRREAAAADQQQGEQQQEQQAQEQVQEQVQEQQKSQQPRSPSSGPLQLKKQQAAAPHGGSSSIDWHIAAAASDATVSVSGVQRHEPPGRQPQRRATVGGHPPAAELPQQSQSAVRLGLRLEAVPEEGSPRQHAKQQHHHQQEAGSSLELTPRHVPASPGRHDTPVPAELAGSSSSDGTGGSSSSDDDVSCSSDEGEAGGLDAVAGGVLSRWFSSPGVSDGMLDPGSARSSPTSQAGRAGRPRWAHAVSHRRHSISAGDPRLHPCWRRSEVPGCRQLEGCSGLDGSCGGSLAAEAAPPPPPRLPRAQLGQLALLWLAFCGLQLGKESFSRCSWQFGLLFACQAALALSLTAFFSRQAARRSNPSLARQHSGEQQPILQGAGPDSAANPAASSTGAASSPAASAHQGTPHRPAALALPSWTGRQLAGASGVCLAGGTLAGTLGIGGGMIIAPLLLELGAHPQAASATSALLVLFSASSAVISFAAAGRLNLPYAALFGCACLVSAAAGTFLIGRAVRRSGRASVLVVLLAGCVGAGALATLGYSGRRAVIDLMRGEHSAGGSFCN